MACGAGCRVRADLELALPGGASRFAGLGAALVTFPAGVSRARARARRNGRATGVLGPRDARRSHAQAQTPEPLDQPAAAWCWRARVELFDSIRSTCMPQTLERTGSFM